MTASGTNWGAGVGEAVAVAAQERVDDLLLNVSQQPDVQHLADHDVDRLGREIHERVRVDDRDDVADPVSSHERRRDLEQLRVVLDAPHLRGARASGEEREHARPAAQFHDLHPRPHHRVDRPLECARPPLVVEHVEVVVDRDELTQLPSVVPARHRPTLGQRALERGDALWRLGTAVMATPALLVDARLRRVGGEEDLGLKGALRRAGIAGAASLVLVVAAPAVSAAPPNDNWADREVIAALPFTDVVTDVATATVETTDPIVVCRAALISQGGNTLWYSYTTGSATEVRGVLHRDQRLRHDGVGL